MEEEALRVELKSKDEMIERLEERLSILENSDSSTVRHENESLFVGGVNHGENLSEDENETSLCCDHTDAAMSGNSDMEGIPEFSLEELHVHHGLKTFSSRPHSYCWANYTIIHVRMLQVLYLFSSRPWKKKRNENGSRLYSNL